jgi:hypothetical protein
MGRLNANIKFVVVNVNLFLFWFGLIFFGLACYLWIADWGDGLTAEFFLGTGIIIALMGIIIMLIAFIGCQGVNNQLSNYGTCVLIGV